MTHNTNISMSASDSVKKEIEDGLLADNIIDHLAKRDKAEEAEATYWRYSKLWNAIEHNLRHGNACLFGSSPNLNGIPAHIVRVTLESVCKYRYGEQLIFSVKFEFEHFAEDSDYHQRQRDTVCLHIPIEFAVDWDEAKWNKWIESVAEKKKEKELLVIEKQLSKLMDKYLEVIK